MQPSLNHHITALWHQFSLFELRLQQQKQSHTKLNYHSTLYLNLILAKPGLYTPSKLADQLLVARPAVTQKINELEKEGYLHKQQSEADKRVFHLFPTQKALDLDLEYEQLDARAQAKLEQDCSAEELASFYRTLDKLALIYEQEYQNTI